MNQLLVNFTKSFFRKFGYELRKIKDRDFSEKDLEIIKTVKPFTQTSPSRIISLINSIEYVVKNNIPGSIVECGIWKGGSVMAAIKTLQYLENAKKEFFLYDTFEGMTKPSEFDVSIKQSSGIDLFSKSKINEQSSSLNNVSLSEVKKNIFSLGYDKNLIHFIKGKVEDTIPENTPKEISILRLDTDWYESTKHELIHLFPRLSKGGILIIDDYGYWKGSKKAVDEYFTKNKIPILLNRIDNSGRIGIKI